MHIEPHCKLIATHVIGGEMLKEREASMGNVNLADLLHNKDELISQQVSFSYYLTIRAGCYTTQNSS